MEILFISRVVATPLVESNIQTIKVKQLQDQLKQMETNTIEAQMPDTSPKGSTLWSPCPSPAHSEGMLPKNTSVCVCVNSKLYHQI